MTPLFALLCFLAPLVGSYVGTKLLEYMEVEVRTRVSKEEYYKWIEENATYPEHSHKWIVRTYTGGELFYRNFGPFETKEEAKEWIENYKVKNTTKGFITRYSIQGLCEVL